ncbi:hypothetical protein O7635_29505 [Asanoa sp. WMMD1127]|uniref:hypothetical protein n=1 Tax=Asanoa sp. WMMD1127 TaxID=3016107 RepID=UPI00241685E7|nr:hypothetical protein [Asanoa sp. WMMD1127]MDG4826006.1 hypothetical protein [Asanoa sp. WMMD1127]
MLYFTSARGGNQIHESTATETDEYQVFGAFAKCTKRKMTGYVSAHANDELFKRCPKCFPAN